MSINSNKEFLDFFGINPDKCSDDFYFIFNDNQPEPLRKWNDVKDNVITERQKAVCMADRQKPDAG